MTFNRISLLETHRFEWCNFDRKFLEKYQFYSPIVVDVSSFELVNRVKAHTNLYIHFNMY